MYQLPFLGSDDHSQSCDQEPLTTQHDAGRRAGGESGEAGSAGEGVAYCFELHFSGFPLATHGGWTTEFRAHRATFTVHAPARLGSDGCMPIPIVVPWKEGHLSTKWFQSSRGVSHATLP